MEWSAGGWKFEQFKDDDYDYVFCLGIQPTSARAWLIPKLELIADGENQERPGLTGQHRGLAAQDTLWLSIDPNNPQPWIQTYGGTIEMVTARIAAIFG
jgi:hypothetical protein